MQSNTKQQLLDHCQLLRDQIQEIRDLEAVEYSFLRGVASEKQANEIHNKIRFLAGRRTGIAQALDAFVEMNKGNF